MNKIHHQRAIFAALAILMLSSIACNLPSAAVTPDPVTVTTSSPTLVPTETATPTQLPPIPEFDELLYLSPGGGGGPITPCDEPYESTDSGFIYSGEVPAVFLAEEYNSIFLCIWAETFDFPVRVSLTSPDGKITLGGTFMVDHESGSPGRAGNVSLDTVSGELFGLYRVVSDTRENIMMDFKWFHSLPVGQWSLTADGGNWQAQSVYEISPPEKPTIEALDATYLSQFHPFSRPRHYSVRLNETGGLVVAGKGFEPNAPVYLVIYLETAQETRGDLQLFYKTVVIAGQNGEVITQIHAPFEDGQPYWLFALMDTQMPTVQADDGKYLNAEAYLPQALFKIRAP